MALSLLKSGSTFLQERGREAGEGAFPSGGVPVFIATASVGSLRLYITATELTATAATSKTAKPEVIMVGRKYPFLIPSPWTAVWPRAGQGERRREAKGMSHHAAGALHFKAAVVVGF